MPFELVWERQRNGNLDKSHFFKGILRLCSSADALFEAQKQRYLKSFTGMALGLLLLQGLSAGSPRPHLTAGAAGGEPSPLSAQPMQAASVTLGLGPLG